MLYQDPHPAHKGFAEAVGADLVNYRGREPDRLGDGLPADVANGLSLPDYDVFIVEGSRPLYTAVINRLVNGGQLVYLCADHGLYALGAGDFEGDSLVKSLIGRFGTPAVRAVGSHSIDGVIAVSEFAAEFTRPVVGEDTPIEIAHPYIEPDLYDDLGEINPDIGGKTAVTVGRASRYKGIDLLVDAWSTVRQTHPDAELHVIGSGHADSYADTDGVILEGYVEDLPEALAQASLFVQPSRMDTFPVSALEALRAGLPAVVTTGTGTRSVARRLDERLVTEPDPPSLAATISWYFGCTSSERRAMGDQARKIGESFNARERKAAFRDAFRRVVRSI